MPGTQQVSSAKRHARDQAIERAAKALSGETDGQGDSLNEYTRADAATIVRKIEAREWTATTVLKAYIRRAIAAQAAVNPITEGIVPTS